MIAQHAQIESVLALELSLTETLARLGLTHARTGKGYSHSIRENGREVHRGAAGSTWEWLRMGCPEGEQC